MENVKIVSFSLPHDVALQVRIVAAKQDKTRSALVAEILRDYLAKEELTKRGDDLSAFMELEQEVTELKSTLVRIASYQTPDQLRQGAGDDYGLDYEEALEMAYENLQAEAKAALGPVEVEG